MELGFFSESIQDNYSQSSFCFKVDSFNNTRSQAEQITIIESFAYLGFAGQIRLQNPDQIFVVHELWSYERPRKLLRMYLGRFVGILTALLL